MFEEEGTVVLIRDVLLQLARARLLSRASALWRSSCAPSSCARATARVSAGSRSTCKRTRDTFEGDGSRDYANMVASQTQKEKHTHKHNSNYRRWTRPAELSETRGGEGEIESRNDKTEKGQHKNMDFALCGGTLVPFLSKTFTQRVMIEMGTFFF